jgi:Na+/H+ antiporter NhaD/arsenite permease-like protein
MDVVVVSVFVFVYAGMVLGEIPGLALDRTGVALLGAIVLIATDRVSTDLALRTIDVPTLSLLFGLMVVSAQFRLGGFYSAVVRRIDRSEHRPGTLLALVIVTSAVLSAVLANDIVCLAMAPMLIEVCARRQLDPIPLLLALCCASNVGSAATLIGNPQNMLIGQALQLSFGGYLIEGGVPALASLVVVWLVIWLLYRRRWAQTFTVPSVATPPYNAWQTWKGLGVVAALLIAFTATALPRDHAALAAAGVLLTSRQMRSREMVGLVDWPLLVLFISLFVVNAAIAASGLLGALFLGIRALGIDIGDPAALFVTTAVLSNMISNVPAVMLLLPAVGYDGAGAILALSSTLAGNLLIVGSIANIIVVDQAKRMGVTIDWRTHARVGIPVTLGTLALAGLWLWASA